MKKVNKKEFSEKNKSISVKAKEKVILYEETLRQNCVANYLVTMETKRDQSSRRSVDACH